MTSMSLIMSGLWLGSIERGLWPRGCGRPETERKVFQKVEQDRGNRV